jgi:hypothetical protein
MWQTLQVRALFVAARIVLIVLDNCCLQFVGVFLFSLEVLEAQVF